MNIAQLAAQTEGRCSPIETIGIKKPGSAGLIMDLGE